MGETKRILVCGGRDFNDEDIVFAALESHVDRMQSTVIQGHAPGADRLAREWCGRNGVHLESYPADWAAHGKAAGPIRNQRMIDEGKPTKVIAFPGGRGTADMVRRARAAGIPVFEFTPTKDTSHGY